MQWWGKLSLDDSRDWYRRQKQVRGRGQNHDWDPTQYEEAQTHSAGSESRIRTVWEDYTMFEERMLLRGSTPADVLKGWEKKLADPAVGAVKQNGIWLVPKFGGVVEDMVSSNMTSHTLR